MQVPFGNVDASWLRMDEPANRMVVTGVLVFDRPVSRARIAHLLETRLLCFPRFRQRTARTPVRVGTTYAWESDPDFSLENHLCEVRLPRPGGEAALQRFVSGLLSHPFPEGRPLWQFHFVPRYRGGSALVMRIHHCIGDGLALIHVLLTLADGHPAPQGPAAPAPERRDEVDAGAAPRALAGEGWAFGQPGAEQGGRPEEGLLGALGARLARSTALALDAALRASRAAHGVLGESGHLKDVGILASKHLASLARLLLLPADPVTLLKGPLMAEKRVAWSRAFRLDDFKAVGRVTGSTINDVLMAALAGALRRYLVARGELHPELSVRGVIPVNLRPQSEAHRLGNRFGLVFLPLPLGIEDPLERLFETRARMRALKQSPEAPAIFELLWAIGAAPRRLFDLVQDIFATKATLVVTNVAGPRAPISIAGSSIRQAMFWVPSAGHLGLGVSLLSYAGEVWLGVQADARLIPVPDEILDAFSAEVDALLALEREARREAELESELDAELAPEAGLRAAAELDSAAAALRSALEAGAALARGSGLAVPVEAESTA